MLLAMKSWTFYPCSLRHPVEDPRMRQGWPELEHIRTKHRSPQTNRVIERFTEPVRYEPLYPLEVPSRQVDWKKGETGGGQRWASSSDHSRS